MRLQWMQKLTVEPLFYQRPRPISSAAFFSADRLQIKSTRARVFIQRRPKFSEAEMALILRQADAVATVGEVCRKAQISEATLYVYAQDS